MRGTLKRDLQRAGSAFAQSHYSGPVALQDVEVSDAQRAPTEFQLGARILPR